MTLAQSTRLESYELTLAPISEDDAPQLHALSVAVKWPHRPDDWRMLAALGEGLIARDEIGRVAGSAMLFPFCETVVGVGMVITSPRLQEHGAGRWLMDHLLARAGGRVVTLNATKAACRLYLSLGFQPTGTVFQHNAVAGAAPPAPPGARSMRPEDAPAIAALDAAARGHARSAVIAGLLARSEGTVLERGGRIAGFALIRPFGRGHVCGPVIADSEQDAIALVAPLVRARQGRFLRMDTRAGGGPLQAWLNAAGLTLHDRVTSMTLGPDPAAAPDRGAATVFGLASQALG